jgi:outer membrane protein assembly factor BamE (lipoprotein component of BamABCDE complex)
MYFCLIKKKIMFTRIQCTVNYKLLIISMVIVSGACSPLATIPARKVEAERLSLGFVQSKIRKGSSGDEVVQILGTPNIVTSNEEGAETWIYDKASSEEEKTSLFSSEVRVKSSRSMIVVIKFDGDKKVVDVQYRQTSY